MLHHFEDVGLQPRDISVRTCDGNGNVNATLQTRAEGLILVHRESVILWGAIQYSGSAYLS